MFQFKNSSFVQQHLLETLENLRKSVNWKIEEDRCTFLHGLNKLFDYWQGQLPNLRDIFRKEEIERLLVDSVKNVHTRRSDDEGKSFVNFVIQSGYTDEPEIDGDGKPLLHRSTALHHACDYDSNGPIVRKLFDNFYNRFDANYTYVDGLSHFHVACRYGFEDIVWNFLEHGQDPNYCVEKTGDTPLHLASKYNKREVMELLLKRGADPNSANTQGWTSLHFICMTYGGGSNNNYDELLEAFFQINESLGKKVEIDAHDESGRTALHFAVYRGLKNAIKCLLSRGADPNWADAKGCTPLHVICGKARDDGSTRMFFEINDELKKQVQVNALDKFGNTPLHFALKSGRKQTAKLLLIRGADLNLANLNGSTPLNMICMREDCSDLVLFLIAELTTISY